MSDTTCLPRCNSDTDCDSATHCDPASGECIRDVPEGPPPGSPCDISADTTPCRGLCLTENGPSGHCIEFCTLGAETACSADPGTPAACLLPITTTAAPAPGDLAACAPLCHCTGDCPEGLACLTLDRTVNGYPGYCALPSSTQTDRPCGEGGAPSD
jgi:hypothetical protein